MSGVPAEARQAARAALRDLAAREMALPPSPNPATQGALVLARDIAAAHGAAVLAILFYGSCRRSGDAGGLLDLYVVHDGHRAFHRRWLPAALNALLPPTVLLRQGDLAGVGKVRAKVAVLSRRQFEARLRAGSMDTTIWARFCQPSTLLLARDDAARDWAAEAAARALAAAARWAVGLGPEADTAAGYWRGLFARTYGAELRAERSGRADTVYEAAPEWFDAALPLALTAEGVPVRAEGPVLHAGAPPPGSWAARRVFGKVLNVARLVKAAFTFEGGADYLAWKVERHSGVRLDLTPWQRRHPIMAAPLLLWRLWRQGAVR